MRSCPILFIINFSINHTISSQNVCIRPIHTRTTLSFFQIFVFFSLCMNMKISTIFHSEKLTAVNQGNKLAQTMLEMQKQENKANTISRKNRRYIYRNIWNVSTETKTIVSRYMHIYNYIFLLFLTIFYIFFCDINNHIQLFLFIKKTTLFHWCRCCCCCCRCYYCLVF